MNLTAVNQPTSEHYRLAAPLVAETKAHGGLAPVDLKRFYADQERAGGNPFGRDLPQCPLGIWMSAECVYDELGVAEDFWRYDHDVAWRRELHRAYNDKSEQVLGRRLLNESVPAYHPGFPGAKGLHDLFEARNVWHSDSWWLQQAAHNEDELQALLDRVEARLANLRAFLLPPEWETAKAKLLPLGIRPGLYRGQRGPITFATSVYGPENLIYLIGDRPELAARFRDCILRGILGIAQVLDEEAGYTPATAPHGWGWCDDNCCLLTPAMYEFFGYPILKAVFERYAPAPGDWRYQHSDSDMAHLVPLLGRLGLSGVNFGPNVRVDWIRQHLPRAVIYGQLAPFTFSRNEQESIVAQFIRDFEQAGDQRGLVFSTAGSINNGSRLTSLRLIMAAIQRFGRYDR